MIRILIVEDDPMVASLNSRLIQTMADFTVAGIANDAKEALELLQKGNVDLMLLDIYMPGMNGLEMLAKVRDLRCPVDVLVVSAARDSNSIQLALRNGAVDYLIKPFDFERLRHALQSYGQRSNLLQNHEKLTQQDLDNRILSKDPAEIEAGQLPKGLDRHTLAMINSYLQELTAPFTTDELSRQVGISRVSVRKYLDYFCDIGHLSKEASYGAVGRPVFRYSKNSN